LDIKPPTPEEYASLASQHSHRFPEKYTVSLPGDHGTTVRIPVVIGNPSGPCKMTLGQKPAPAWSNFLAPALRVRA